MTTTAEKEGHTPAYKIFHYYYQCQVAQHFLYSEEYVTTFGLPTTENASIDKEMSSAMVPAQLTISEMAEALDDGVNVVLVDPHDAVGIYHIINAHLEGWRKHITSGMGGLEPPIDDLRKLDVLATEIYKVGRCYMPDPEEGRSLLQNLSRLERRRGVRRDTGVAPPPKHKVVKEHTSISDIIAKETFQRNSRWQ